MSFLMLSLIFLLLHPTTPSCPPLKVVHEPGPTMGQYWLTEDSSEQAKEWCGNGCLYKDIMGEEFCFKKGPGEVENFVYKHDDL